MKVLFLSEQGRYHRSDLYDVLTSCGVDVVPMDMKDAIGVDLSAYDAYCVLGGYWVLDARLRSHLEEESGRKHVFLEAVGSFAGIYSDEPKDTTRSRLVYIAQDCDSVEGLEIGDLLDDEANRMMNPWLTVEGYRPSLVYREQIIAHAHTSEPGCHSQG